jgi:hypothetical protein
MTKVYTVHGWNDHDGKLTTDRLHPFFQAEGYETEAYDYGWHIFVSARNAKWAKELTKRVEENSIGVAHSNGCAILQRASLLGAPFKQLVFINPALKADAKVGPQIKACHVYYSPGDIGLRISHFFPWSEWGSMGATGPTGGWPPFIGYNKLSDIHPFWMRSATHLDMFLPDKLAYWGKRIAKNVKAFELTTQETHETQST